LLLGLEKLWWSEQTPHHIGMSDDHILLLGESHTELKCCATLLES
jgi:hypothetical protein